MTTNNSAVIARLEMQRDELTEALWSALEEGYWSGGEWIMDKHVPQKIENALANLDSEPAEQPAVPEGWSVEDVANKVCANMPEGCAVLLCMEEGSANVELYDLQGDRRLLPDSADKTLIEQLNDAVDMAQQKGRE